MPNFRPLWYLQGCLIVTHIWLSLSNRVSSYTDVIIENGTTHNFSCSISSVDVQQEIWNAKDVNLSQEFKWQFKGENLSSDDHTIIAKYNNISILTLSTASFNDSGDYECIIIISPLNITRSVYYRLLVGAKPSKPKNFRCASTDGATVNCRWETGNITNIPTNYTCHWMAGRTRYNRESKDGHSCELSSFNYIELENIFVNASNKLGSAENSQLLPKFNLYTMTIPNPPKDLQAIGGNKSVTLTWNNPSDWKEWLPLQYKIRINNQIEKSPEKLERKKNHIKLVTNLDPYTNYTFEMTLNCFDFNDNWSQWSLPTNAQTLQAAPASDQNLWTDDGMSILRHYNCSWEDIYLQWKSKDEIVWNGVPGNFCIIFSENTPSQCNISNGCCINENQCITLPADSNNYTKIGIQRDITRRVCITAINSIGCTPLDKNCKTLQKYEYSEPSIPQHMSANITEHKIIMKWDKTLSDCEPTFNIRWNETKPCNNKENRYITKSVNTTKNSLEITHLIPKMEYTFVFVTHNRMGKKSEEYYKSLTTLSSAPTSTVYNLTVLQSNLSSELIIRGMLPFLCEENGITIDGYTIHYSNLSTVSKIDKLFITGISRDLNFSHTITNLRPYTNYRIQVSLFTIDSNSKKIHGPKSELVSQMTKEGNPGIVQNVNSNISRNDNLEFTIALRWDPPQELQGKLENYTLKITKYFNTERNQNWSVKNIKNETSCNLENLECYTKYRVQLTACISTRCGTPVNFDIQTPFGVPTAPGQIKIENHLSGNGEIVKLKWNEPQVPNGPISYYRIKYYPLSNISQQILKIAIFNDTTINLDCNEFKEYGVVVAAVNENSKSQENIVGNYSQEKKIQCPISKGFEPIRMEILFILPILSICITLIVFFALKFYRKYCSVPTRANLPTKRGSLDECFERTKCNNVKMERFDDLLDTTIENNNSDDGGDSDKTVPNKDISAYSSLSTKLPYVQRKEDKNPDHVKVSMKTGSSGLLASNYKNINRVNKEESSSSFPLLPIKRKEEEVKSMIPEQHPLIDQLNE